MANQRTYQRTHPWINFQMELNRAPARLWIMLGECQSKCEHLSGVPLKAATAEQLHGLYLAKGVHATTAIEGNTLTEEEVQRQLEGKLKLPPSREYLAQETKNIIDECNRIRQALARGGPSGLTQARIQDVNRAVLENLDREDHVAPGEIRRYSVGVMNYRAAPWEDCDHLLDRLCSWLARDEFIAPPGFKIAYAIIQAVIAHLYLAWIHPFGDGNGRTARLIEFELLISSGVPAPAAHLLSNHYYLTRTEYYRQLDRAGKSGGQIWPLLEYAVQGFLDGLRTQLSFIREQQLQIAWRDFVYESFRQRRSAADQRRRDLVLELAKDPEPTPASKLIEINPRIAREYAKKTMKTLARDINELRRMELIAVEKGGIRARREIILAFLPFQSEPTEKETPPAD